MLETSVHKYLTYEAWELVKIAHREVRYSVMNGKIGNSWNDPNLNGSVPFQKGKVITGAYREDEEDLVWDNHGILGQLTTATHFWNADAGSGSVFTPTPGDRDFPNAYQKLQAYWTGHAIIDDVDQPWLILGPFYYGMIRFKIKVAFKNDDGSYTTLADAYKNPEKFKVVAWTDMSSAGVYWKSEPDLPIIPYLIENTYGINQMTDTDIRVYIDRVVWEIVGRMCHLIEDSGVPAHAHNNEHPFFEFYENNWMRYANYQRYTRGTAYLQAQQLNQPLLFDLSSKNNPLMYAIYTTNQVADRFASDGCTTPLGCNPTPGDYSFSSFTPYAPGFSSDYVYDVIQPIYDRVNGVTTHPSAITWNYADIIAENAFNFSMRTTASFLWYVYQKFNIQSSTEAVIHNITSTSPDYKVYRGEIVKLTAHSNNPPNVTYDWFVYSCGPDNCEVPVTGLDISANGNILTINNWDYQYRTCQNCAPIDAPVALYYTIKVTAKTPYTPPCTYSYNMDITPMAERRTFTGCPFVYVQNESGEFISDNNLLHRSEFAENVGIDISDKYLLNVKPGVFDEKIKLNLFETTHDISSINSIKLLAVDHPAGTKIGVTESNDIVMYYTADAESPKNASKNHIEDITRYIQYTNGNGDRRDTTVGLEDDNVISDFEIPSLRSKLERSKNKFRILGRAGLDSTALIMRMGMNPDLDRPPVIIPAPKDRAGTINLSSDVNSLTTDFARREYPSDVIIPFGQNTSIEKADIQWNRDYQLLYAAVVDVFYSGFDVTELPLTAALSSSNTDLISALQNIDGDYAVLDSSGIIMLEFSNAVNNSGMIRDYIIQTDGQYSAPGTYRPAANLRNNNAPKETTLGLTNKLSANYPNPFNPVTKINYEIKREGFVSLKIYNVVGQLVKELVGEFKNAGSYTVEFNGSALASGTYYYRIESGDFVETKKMILIK
jgi:hypothetical protein